MPGNLHGNLRIDGTMPGERRASERRLMEAVLALRVQLRDAGLPDRAGPVMQGLMAQWAACALGEFAASGLAGKIAERLTLASCHVEAGDVAAAGAELTRAYMLMCCARAGMARPQSARAAMPLRTLE